MNKEEIRKKLRSRRRDPSGAQRWYQKYECEECGETWEREFKAIQDMPDITIVVPGVASKCCGNEDIVDGAG